MEVGKGLPTRRIVPHNPMSASIDQHLQYPGLSISTAVHERGGTEQKNQLHFNRSVLSFSLPLRDRRMKVAMCIEKLPAEGRKVPVREHLIFPEDIVIFPAFQPK